MEHRKLEIRLNSGLSIISAFANWKGAALALDHQMIMNIHEEKEPKNTWNIRMVLRELSRIYKKEANIKVEITQKIPAGMGMKSSSALVAGIVKAFSLFNDIEMSTEKIVSISSKISRDTKTSATGAADDLYASLLGGLCVTDNRKNVLSRRYIVPSRQYVIITSKRKISSYEMRNLEIEHMRKLYDNMWKRVNSHNYEDIAVMNGFYLSQASGQSMELPDIKELGFSSMGLNGKGASLFLKYENVEIMKKDLELLDKRKLRYIVGKSTNTGSSYKWVND